jgi:hypothetical protein
MTDLEAVNRMLGSIGQAPVNTLDVPGVGDVADAKRHLNEALRDVQTVGYAWNTDYGFALTRDAITGFILIPDGALDVDVSDSSVNAVERTLPTTGQRALYDTDNHTFVFTDDITADIIWGFGFNDLPQAARSPTSRPPPLAASRPRRSTPRSSTASTPRTRSAPSSCSSDTSAAPATPTVSAAARPSRSGPAGDPSNLRRPPWR